MLPFLLCLRESLNVVSGYRVEEKEFYLISKLLPFPCSGDSVIEEGGGEENSTTRH